MQILRPIGLSALGIIMFIGLLALTTELMEVEQVAKVVVIPSLILLISVTGYCMLQYYRFKNLR